MIGQTYGKYRIVDRLGRGGMGTVYRAVDETLDRDVAIKVLNPDLADSEVVRRFRAEATTLARLNHPGIATVYELYRDAKELFLVMEFVRGETLDKVADRWGPVTPDRAAHVALQILEPLSYAHRAGIVHRDLKPANLMLTEFGTIKIMDFGIARVVGSEHMTNDGVMMGTPAYMAPEQVLGDDVDGRADLYAVGVILYRLLTGNLPFRADTAIAMVQKQIKDPPTPLRQFRSELPAWCETVLDRALAKLPADRFQTADAFKAALAASGVSASGALPIPGSLRQPADPLETTLPPDTPSPAATAPPLAQTLPPTMNAQSSVVAPAAPPTTVMLQQETQPVPRATTDATVVLKRRHVMAGVAVVGLGIVIATAGVAFVIGRRGTSPFTGSTAVSPAPVAPASARSTAAPPAAMAPSPSNPPSPSIAPPTSIAPSGAGAAASPNVPSTTAALPEAKLARGARTPREAAPAARTVVPAITFAGMKTLITDGNKAVEQDTDLKLTDRALTSMVKGAPERTVPYSAILSAAYSRSRHPLWNSPAGPTVVVKNAGGGGFPLFRSGDRHWLTIRTRQAFFIFRLKPEQVASVTAALAERSGKPVEQLKDK